MGAHGPFCSPNLNHMQCYQSHQTLYTINIRADQGATSVVVDVLLLSNRSHTKIVEPPPNQAFKTYVHILSEI